MTGVLKPWNLIMCMLIGWANREQQLQIEFLLATIEVLKERQSKKRILLTDNQRRKLAVKAKGLGRKGL